MNKPHIPTLEQRKRNRQCYIRRKSKAIYDAIATGLLTMFICFLAYGLFRDGTDHGWYFSKYVTATVLGIVSLAGLFSVRKSVRQAKAIRYVPPVREHKMDLPANEILVRGSEPPAASPGELLRAVNRGSETASEELLRPKESIKT